MASRHVAPGFLEQMKESRKKIRDSFKRSHEALQVRESILLSRVDEIEREYNSRSEEMNKVSRIIEQSNTSM